MVMNTIGGKMQIMLLSNLYTIGYKICLYTHSKNAYAVVFHTDIHPTSG